MNAPTLSVAAPCYNEEEGIAAVVEEWNAVLDDFPEPSEIVLCNDGSTDGTAAVLERLCARYPRLRVVTASPNGGYGRALALAIGATRGDFVATIDSDGQFDLRDAFPLLETLRSDGYDGVTGYRRKKHDSVVRVVGDRVLNRIVRAMFRLDLRDTNCALKVFRGDAIRGLRIEARGYPTPTEICVRFTTLGYRLGEGPVAHRERGAGESKLNPLRTGSTMLRFLFYLRRRLRLYERRILLEP